MSKSAVTRLFVAGIVAFVAGFALAFAAVLAAIAGGSITIGGPAILTIDGAGLGGALAMLAFAAVLIGGGMVVGLIAWIGALVNTFQLEDKTWFVMLLVLGLWSFGFVAMIAYVVVGPDGARPGVTPVGVAAKAGS
jgi:hypothetical protein